MMPVTNHKEGAMLNTNTQADTNHANNVNANHGLNNGLDNGVRDMDTTNTTNATKVTKPSEAMPSDATGTEAVTEQEAEPQALTRAQMLARAAECAARGEDDEAMSMLKMAGKTKRSRRVRQVGDEFTASVGVANGTLFVRVPVNTYADRANIAKGSKLTIKLHEDTIVVSGFGDVADG